jgi:hypothetical protein
MCRKLVCFLGILAFVVVMTACAVQELPESTLEISPGATSTVQNLLPAGCQPDQVLLRNLEAQLPYQQVEVIHQAFGGEHTLVIWIVDPELSSGFSARDVQVAVQRAAASAQVLNGASVCVRKFDLLHLTVVGADYTQWFSGAFRPGDVPTPAAGGSGGGPQGERGAGVSLVTAMPVSPPGEDICIWTDAQAALVETFAEMEVQGGMYYVRDENGNHVFLHWVLPEGIAAVDSLALLEPLAAQLACLYPRPSGISLTVSGQDGTVVLTAYLPGSASRRGTEFELDDLTYQELGGAGE